MSGSRTLSGRTEASDLPPRESPPLPVASAPSASVSHFSAPLALCPDTLLRSWPTSSATENFSFPFSSAAPPRVAFVSYVIPLSSSAPVGTADDVIASFQSDCTTSMPRPPRATRRFERLACDPGPQRKRRLRSALVSSSVPPSLELELESVLSSSSCRRLRSDPSRQNGCSCSESVSS